MPEQRAKRDDDDESKTHDEIVYLCLLWPWLKTVSAPSVALI
jgi:hypothetical protein